MYLEWMERGACKEVGHDEWFPDKGGPVAIPKLICNGDGNRVPPCPVKALCGQYALDNNERHGVWGGMTERERRKIRDARARDAA